MTYTVSVTCDGCGASAPSAITTKDASALAVAGGWVAVRHVGKHFCRWCYPAYMASIAPKPRKRTKEDRMRENWAATSARLKVILTLRRSGKTFRECGEAANVSATRAQQMVAQAELAEARGWTQPNCQLPTLEEITTKAGGISEDTPISDLEISVRAEIYLREMAVHTVGQMLSMADTDFSKLPQPSAKVLREIKTIKAAITKHR